MLKTWGPLPSFSLHSGPEGASSFSKLQLGHRQAHGGSSCQPPALFSLRPLSAPPGAGMVSPARLHLTCVCSAHPEGPDPFFVTETPHAQCTSLDGEEAG